MGEFEILEHTADVGVRATGDTPEDAFEAATLGLAETAGIWRPGEGETIAVELESEDLGALLVDWLSEVLYLHDSRRAAIAGVDIDEVTDTTIRGSITLADLGEGPGEGTQVKAITYHQLSVEKRADGWTAQVFFDI